MTKEQLKELEKHHNRINDKGEPLIKGSMLWLVLEALENVERLEELIGPKHNRPSKTDIKLVLRDLRDQIRELKVRLD